MNFSDIPDSANCKQCRCEFKPETPGDKYCRPSHRTEHEKQRRKELKDRKNLLKINPPIGSVLGYIDVSGRSDAINIAATLTNATLEGHMATGNTNTPHCAITAVCE